MGNVLFNGKQVKQVYSGKVRKCCCGCCGNHTKTEDNPKFVERFLRKFQKLSEDNLVEDLESCVVIDTETRRYIVYFS